MYYLVTFLSSQYVDFSCISRLFSSQLRKRLLSYIVNNKIKNKEIQ